MSFQMLEELRDFTPHLGAARKTAPVQPDQSDQPIAFIDGNNEVFANGAYPIH